MTNIMSEMSLRGYWPALALEYLNEKRYSRAVELCNMRLQENESVLSGRIILARALFHSGQIEAAEDEFYRILHKDPENLAALKYLGDIKYSQGDISTAFSYYTRVQEIEPRTAGLSNPVRHEKQETTRVLTLKKNGESVSAAQEKIRELPFKTETVGDLLLAQGHSRMALEIFRELAKRSDNPRFREKIEKIETEMKNKDKKNV